MKNKKYFFQNSLILLPFIHLFVINVFQIRTAETVKLATFAVLYLLFFNLLRYFLHKYLPIKNSDYFAVIIFYLSFNYSNITIFIYFEAFEFIKFVPNYSFFSFILLLIILLVASTKNSFDKLFEFSTFTYFVLILIISFNSININQEQNNRDVRTNGSYENIKLIERPDVYFIIYDGLPSLPTMERFYNYDTRRFDDLFSKNKLTKYNLAASSYGRTKYTMSSLFNMEYIFQAGDIPFSDRANLSERYRSGNSVFENILRNNDYSLYKFGLAFNCNESRNDKCITENIENYREKNSVYFDLIMRTPFKILIEKGYIKLSPSLSIGCKDGCGDPELSEIFNNINSNDKPKAVFFHFMDTHGPYLLGENCELLDDPIFDLPKTNIKSYKKSLNCAYLKIETLIENLDLENDIVFIQSDHGPNYDKMELTSIEDLTFEQVLNRYSTFSISNLDNFCDEENVDLNRTVNTFIYFVNCFGTSEIALLEVKNFLAFGKINSFVFDITKFVQETISANYK